MIIKLPHIEPIDTLALTDDFEDKVKESFAKFTELTNRDYTHEDKLMYLDNLRRYWLHKNICGIDAVKDMILERAEFEIDEYGVLPDKDDYRCLEFMGECYEKGRDIGFRDKEYENNHRKNDETLKVIARIIQIVMNWEG